MCRHSAKLPRLAKVNTEMDSNMLHNVWLINLTVMDVPKSAATMSFNLIQVYPIGSKHKI